MRFIVSFAVLLALPVLLSANVLSYQGNLDTNDPEGAAVIHFRVSATGAIGFRTFSWGGGTNGAGTPIPSGGFDPYVSIFQGTDTTATFISSNDDASYPTNLDSLLVVTLNAGDYTLALTQGSNMSYAENWGTGTIGDGWTGLGSFNFGGLSTAWAVDIDSNPSSLHEGPVVTVEDLNPSGVPEPGTCVLMGVAFAVLGIVRRRTFPRAFAGRVE